MKILTTGHVYEEDEDGDNLKVPNHENLKLYVAAEPK